MTFLRTASTRRLLATLAVVLTVVAAGTAIAVAADGTGPVPKPASLAAAVHEGLSAPKIVGITADISFTNHLIDASSLQGSDPLLQGATGRLWYSPATHQLRLELQSDNGDAEVVVNDGRFWISDPDSNTVYQGTLPRRAAAERTHSAAAHSIPSIPQIQSALTKLARHVDVGAAVPSDTAGQPTYSVTISPKHDGGLLGAAQIAFDAARGVPLDLAVYASGNSSPVLELKATGISFGAVAPSVFDVPPPSGDKVVSVSPPAQTHHGVAGSPRVSGIGAVAAALPFTLAAPATVAGLPRRAVTMMNWAGQPAAMVSYGQGIGAIAVIQRSVSASGTTLPQGAMAHRGLSLPTVSIAGHTANELDTALGTVITFQRGNVRYVVIGSVPPVAAEAAAADIEKAP